MNIANLIGGIVSIMIGVMLIGPITEQINLAIGCTHVTSSDIINDSLGSPLGKTDSFGGEGVNVGVEQFGGYTGKLSHKTFIGEQVVKVNTDGSGEICGAMANNTGNSVILLKLVPTFFTIAIVITGIATICNAFSDDLIVLYTGKKNKKKKKVNKKKTNRNNLQNHKHSK